MNVINKIIHNILFYRLGVSFVAFVISFLIRPMLLGQSYTIIGTAALFIVGVTSCFYSAISSRELRKNLNISVSVVLLWSFLCVHSVVNHVPEPFAFYALVNMTLSMIGGALLFGDVGIRYYYFNMFRMFFALSAVSMSITVVLAQIGGMDRLLLYTIDVTRYEGIGGQVYFPLTFGYGLIDYGSLYMTRLAAGFREAGIAQAFISAAIIGYPEFKDKRSIIIFILLVFSGFSTQSTTGIALVGLAILARMSFDESINRLVKLGMIGSSLIVAALAIDFAINDEGLGFANKLQTEFLLGPQNSDG